MVYGETVPSSRDKDLEWDLKFLGCMKTKEFVIGSGTRYAREGCKSSLLSVDSRAISGPEE